MQTSTNSRKLKGGWKIFLVGVVKNVYGQPNLVTRLKNWLYPKNEQIE